MKLKLWQQVLIGLVLGVVFGYFCGPKGALGPLLETNLWGLTADKFLFLGKLFITLIKMVMVPVIFFALVSGITSMAGTGSFKRVGLKATLAYLSTAAFAVVIGLVTGHLLQPGVGVDLSALAGSAMKLPDTAAPTFLETIMNVVPDNAIGAMANANILQVIVFAIFFGATLNVMGEKARRIIDLCQDMAKICFKMIEIIIKTAPFGVFGFMAWTVATMGMDILMALAKLCGAVLIACLVQYLLFGVILSVFGRISPMPFYKKIFAVQLLAFSTTSSKATLPTTMATLREEMGVSESSTNFVLPLGAAINMDGTAIYLGMCAVFFAQTLGINLQFHDYLVLILTATLGSIGAAGIPSGSLIFMGMVLSSVGLPIAGIGIIAGVDRILDMFRTTINITGDAAITVAIDSSEGTLNKREYNAPMNSQKTSA